MPLTTLPSPCWTITCSHEDIRAARWRPHTRHPAQLPAHPDGCDLPYQLDSSCIEAICDRCGAAYARRHFATAEQAIADLERAGWTSDRHQRWHCDRCPILFDLTPEARAAVVRPSRREIADVK